MQSLSAANREAASRAALQHVLQTVDLPSPANDNAGSLRDEDTSGALSVWRCAAVTCNAVPPLCAKVNTATKNSGMCMPMDATTDRTASRSDTHKTPSDPKQEAKRANWRRKNQRKAMKLSKLRDEVKAVETEVKRLRLQAQSRPTQTSSSASQSSATASESQLALALQEKANLRSENVQLRKLFRQATAHNARLQELLGLEHRLYLANSSYFAVLRPLTLPDCEEIIQSGLEQAATFALDPNNSLSSGAICGWKHRRSLDHTSFRFSLSKLLRNQPVEQVMERAWQILTKPVMWEKLFSPGSNARVRLVQRIDDDHMIFFRDSAAMNSDGVWILESTMTLLSRSKSKNGCQIVMRGLDHGRVHVDDRLSPQIPSGEAPGRVVEVWNTHFCRINLEQVGKDCQAAFSGFTPTVSANSHFWLMEVLRQMLRWERAVLGLKFSVPAEFEDAATST